jgi:hypothetical protein
VVTPASSARAPDRHRTARQLRTLRRGGRRGRRAGAGRRPRPR